MNKYLKNSKLFHLPLMKPRTRRNFMLLLLSVSAGCQYSSEVRTYILTRNRSRRIESLIDIMQSIFSIYQRFTTPRMILLIKVYIITAEISQSLYSNVCFLSHPSENSHIIQHIHSFTYICLYIYIYILALHTYLHIDYTYIGYT